MWGFNMQPTDGCLKVFVVISSLLNLINPFSTNVLLLYLLKTSENLRFLYVLRGNRSETLVENVLSKTVVFKI